MKSSKIRKQVFSDLVPYSHGSDTDRIEHVSIMKNPANFYRDLNRDIREIRLINLQKGSFSEPVRCKIQYTSLDNPTPYDALSYTWEKRDQYSQVLVDDCLVDVTPNLLSALLRLRYSENDRLLWIDYICINQEDLQEKNSQVTEMFQIYSKASMVAIWVGEHHDDSDLAVQCLKDFEAQHDPVFWLMSLLTSKGHNKPVRAVLKLLWRQYFHRVWVIQEVAAATASILYCGDLTISYDTIIRFCKAFTDDISYGMISSAARTDATDIMVKHQFALINNMMPRPGQVNPPNRAHFLDTVVNFEWKQSSDPRDRLYALFSILDLPERLRQQLPIDYTLSTTELFTRFARLTIENTKRLDILGSCYLYHDPVPGMREEFIKLPSWVPDWSRRSNNITKAMEDGKHWQDIHPDARRPGCLVMQDSKINAGPRELVCASFLDGQAILRVKGIFLESITSNHTHAFHYNTSSKPDHLHDTELIRYISECHKLILRSITTALMTVQTEQMAPTDLQQLKAWCISTEDNFLTMLYYNLHKPDGTIRKWWREWLRTSTLDGTVHVTGAQFAILSFMRDILQNRFAFCRVQVDANRRLRTLMGLAPGSAQEGDSICLIKGCKSPLVLRKMPSGHHVIVGDVFLSSNVYGYTNFEDIMYGEVFEKERARLEDITLC